ncbi:phospholipase B1, membrane-associated-like [Ptychodera flava]|uniref:phospholipase B1, membrane-associated-like n=1 Tax=Ptychodera flava TaxID=63121 RepID=UPI00396A9EE4
MEMKIARALLAACFLPSLLCSEWSDDEPPEIWWNNYVKFLKYYGGDDNGPPFQPPFPFPPELPELPELPEVPPTAPPEFPIFSEPPPILDIRCLEYELMDVNFTCDPIPRSDPRPTSVHELRPGDIDVVAALGDSITAGNGARADCLIEVVIMGRELAFSIGGNATLQDGAVTLPNILRNYNPNLTGYSVASSPDFNEERSRLNVAVPGARSRHMLEQTEEMIRRMKEWDEMDFENDWKMVTIFIGGNDLCRCSDNYITAEEYAGNIKLALDLMHSEMPRTFVNMVQVMLVTELNKMTTPFCNLAHRIACECAKEIYNEDWELILQLTKEYHRAVDDMILYGQYDTRDDFTVVIQPFFEELNIEENDPNILSPDCFHFSEFGHQISAMSLWNNLIEPAGQKRKAWTYDDVIECPSKDSDFLYTYLNTPGYEVPTRGPSAETPTEPPSTTQTPEPAPKYNFTCPYIPPSNEVPTSVHELRPGDVTVLGALGDSITAGFAIAAENLLQIGIQYRGLSWSIGGDNSYEDGTLTLTNILRNYNPDIKGYSIETGSHNNYNISRLNVAVGGARARHMLSQTEDLIERLKTWDAVDYENDWKVVTLFIGGNDLCAYCRDPEGSTTAAFKEEIKKALDKMHAEMPRTFVNLVQVLLVTEVNKLDGYCDIIHLLVCPCAKERWDENWEDVLDLARDYHRAMEDLVLYGDYDTRDDFTVVIQPFYEETYVPWLEEEGKWDDSLFSPDCFHFSEYGHQVSAMSLWNNMIEPVGSKRKGWVPEDIVECPPEGFEYFYTYKNTPGYEIPTRGPSTLPPTTVEPTPPYKFECEITGPSNEVPTSVHRLRPADVNVVAALGDSITAANGAGAENLIQVAIQYRGLSWSVGGDESLNNGVLTLSNILRKYNPELKGFSIETGSHTNVEISRLNVAVPGARARHMLEQTEELITRMKDRTEVDYENDWKVVTVFIGGNDLCACSNYSAEEYTAEIEKALDLMHQEMPRTFVNLAQVVLVTEINKLTDGLCDIFHLAYCSCGKEIYNEDWEEVLHLTHEYHRALENLVASGKYDTREDFTVVLQPFFEETYVPPNEDGSGWDHSMFSPDCFHFSEYGHQMCAMSLWNNMIEPVGDKRRGWNPDDIIECPPEGFEYLYTNLNSPGYQLTTQPPAPQTTVAVEPRTKVTVKPTEKEEDPGSSEPVCDDPYSTGFIVTISICIALLVVCVCGIIYLSVKVSRFTTKSDPMF